MDEGLFGRLHSGISVTSSQDFLRLNVGFIIHQTTGYSRDFPLDYPVIRFHPDIVLKDVSGTARVTRTTQGLLLQVTMRAFTSAQCVRCLDEFLQLLDIEFTELYAFSRESATETELVLPENGQIEMAPLVRDEMLLAVPISPICRLDCKGLCPICGENRNEFLCDHDEEDIDPRMDVLKSLLNADEE